MTVRVRPRAPFYRQVAIPTDGDFLLSEHLLPLAPPPGFGIYKLQLYATLLRACPAPLVFVHPAASPCPSWFPRQLTSASPPRRRSPIPASWTKKSTRATAPSRSVSIRPGVSTSPKNKAASFNSNPTPASPRSRSPGNTMSVPTVPRGTSSPISTHSLPTAPARPQPLRSLRPSAPISTRFVSQAIFRSPTPAPTRSTPSPTTAAKFTSTALWSSITTASTATPRRAAPSPSRPAHTPCVSSISKPTAARPFRSATRVPISRNKSSVPTAGRSKHPSFSLHSPA